MPVVAVIIVAAGRGQRFVDGLPQRAPQTVTGAKQYVPLAGRPVIYHAIRAFSAHAEIDLVQPVIHADDVAAFADAAGDLDALAPVIGGETRQASVLEGLKALAPRKPDLVLVHDAARPFVPSDMIDRVLNALTANPGAIPAVAVVDTLKRTNEDGVIDATVPRENLWRAQTPQGFDFEKLLAAHEVARGQSLTDDAAVMEAAGHDVVVVDGDARNIKITVPADLREMEHIMPKTRARDTGTAPPFRIGNGFDVHRLGPGDGVMLCGVLIPCPLALIGHSDADVALHAVTDAILGAIGAGDIGTHFPPSDETWRGASSDKFLQHACGLAAEAGYEIANIDLTLLCERPKIGPHRDALVTSLARISGTGTDCVSVKATTTEKLGFTGRGEGIAAQASVLLERA